MNKRRRTGMVEAASLELSTRLALKPDRLVRFRRGKLYCERELRRSELEARSRLDRHKPDALGLADRTPDDGFI